MGDGKIGQNHFAAEQATPTEVCVAESRHNLHLAMYYVFVQY